MVPLAMWVNRDSVYHSRFITAYWQKCGYQVIPTASWGDANSFKYCFEGLPEHSVIAVCGIGHDQDKSRKTLWHIDSREEADSPCHLGW